MAVMPLIWARMGFGYTDVQMEDKPGFQPGCISQDVFVRLLWWERLLVLISGKLHFQLRTQTDVIPGRMRALFGYAVLPPHAVVGRDVVAGHRVLPELPPQRPRMNERPARWR